MRKRFGLGKAFGDSIIQSLGRKDHRNFKEGEAQFDIFFTSKHHKTDLKIPIWRVLPFYLISIAFFLLLVTKLFNLQIIEGSNFYNISEKNRIRLKVIRAPRGVIYDRNGQILAQNMPGFRVVLDPTKLGENKNEIINSLASILKVSQEELRLKVEKSVGPLTVKNEVDRDAIFAIESQEKFLKGVEVEVSPIRQYLYPEELSHLIGYTGEISEKELKEKKVYQAGDRVGRSGVEETYEKELRGIDGYELIKVSAFGKREGDILTTKPQAGKNINLSIDLGLQKKMKEALLEELKKAKACCGSAVAMDPRTGEVLGMVSVPYYDNNLFAKGISTEDYLKLINDIQNPLLNRVISGAYPPGSIFKIVTSAAGLMSGKLNKDTKIEDTGYVQLGSIRFHNWLFTSQGKTDGILEVTRALARSNDIFFYRVGQMIGEKLIQEWAKIFNLGEKTQIALSGEIEGLVPTEEWKLKTRGEPWYPGETLNLSIGQGDLLLSPIQVGVLTSAIANGGRLMKPLLIKGEAPQVVKDNLVSPEALGLIRSGMKQALETGGTGWTFFDFKVPSAGKTGTAETGTKKTHAWFTVFAPYENPEIVLSVMMEHAGEGSNVGGPVARKVFDYWFFQR